MKKMFINKKSVKMGKITKQQIPVLAARVVEFQEEFSALSSEDAQWGIMNTKEMMTLFVNVLSSRAKSVAQTIAAVLGTIVSTFTVPATTEKFVAKDKLKVDTSKKAAVKISYLGDDFRAWFIGKTEDQFIGSTVYGRKLKKDSVDSPILAELGGNEAAETTLTELYAAMAAQPNGESGNLLNGGWANIFYIKDVNGILRAVDARWSVDGWYLDAISVEDTSRWLAGRRAFSRNSLAPQTI